MTLRGVQELRKAVARVVRNRAGTITRVATEEAVAALTFDDGPHPVYTPRLLGILERHRALATFFMVGQAASAYPDLVLQAAKAGHAIGNHTWSHLGLPSIKRKERWRELRACQRALAPYGHPLFRPPYGEQSLGSHFDVFCLGYAVVAFSADVADWWDPDPYRMAESAVRAIQPGSIFVFHDSLFDGGKPRHSIQLSHEARVDRGAMLVALQMLLEAVSTRFRFVTIPELLNCGRPHRENWYVRW